MTAPPNNGEEHAASPPGRGYDVAIIGAGIVGLATARALALAHPRARLVVLEKEKQIASHQTGHNSGVIHSGIYYKPGSLKARLCVEGARELKALCTETGIPFQPIGKVIVATRPDQLPRLRGLYERGQANGVPGVEELSPERLSELEPHARGVQAIYSPGTAIVDYSSVAAVLAEQLLQRGVEIKNSARVLALHSESSSTHLETNAGAVESRCFINCAGLQSDEIARLSGLRPGLTIIPFRGEYYLLRPSSSSLIRGLVYPVPDPRLPFLGVHFTRRIKGQVEAGPNAVLALAREGYRRSDISLPDLRRLLLFSGLWRMGLRWWRTGIFEYYRSFSRRAFVRSLQELVPEISADDLDPGGAGVRAQAVSAAGELVDDFYFLNAPRALHVLNTPSPAATASLAIGRYIADEAARSFDLPRK